MSGWHRTLGLSASWLLKNLLNHLKMVGQVLKWSILAPTTKAKKHQAPFRAPTLCNGSEAVGANKSLRARGEPLSSIGAFCPWSEAFYWTGPALIICIMWPQCIAYIKANAIHLYTSGLWTQRLLSKFWRKKNFIQSVLWNTKYELRNIQEMKD